MKNSLTMRTEASYSLNFLIYIQNIYFNHCLNREEEYKFPYFPQQTIAFKEEFELNYRKLWHQVAKRIAKHHINDPKIFYKEKDIIFQELFITSDESLKKYEDLYHTFKVWWDSFAGRFSIERSTDERGQKLYWELAKLLEQNGKEPEKELNISIIYDEYLFSEIQKYSYFNIVPINDFYVNYRELPKKLLESVD
ncbi:hypothetical protein CFK37_17080 [Virgibacillus phasianinus]|uniref:Uncharacterized protein n=1 Tax=Virgibacillus phasianinus TaxID=2017483 RepID=A0A220U779_9BACI|nr:L-rhamnose mutarotase [Virgibacillus phasianinus]ASK63746.1 hypothetical protein CFK37_17080 [Virgibacillus phasianinus]